MADYSKTRNSKLNVKLSEEEKAILFLKANEADMTMSDAIRSLVVNGTIDAKWLDEESKEKVEKFYSLMDSLEYEVCKIGNNINQISYWALNKTYPISMKELQEEYYDLCCAKNDFLDCIQESIGWINANNTYKRDMERLIGR
ncbi:MAG: hypothetical protein LIV11_05790 [Bacillota bacterium]|nr:hypothetical protein [Bacillota bacterium]